MTTPGTDAATRTPVPHRTASTLLGLVPSALVLAVAALVVLSWRDELPDPVATHFKPDGPDGFTPLVPFVLLVVGLFGVLALGAWLLAVVRGRDAMTRRLGVGLGTGMAVFGAVLLVGTLGVQRGLADAADTPDIDPVIAMALAAGLGIGALAAWAVPGDPPAPPVGPLPADGARVPLGAQERAAWTGRVVSPVGIGVGGGGALLVVVLALTLRMPSLLVLVVAMGLLVLTSASITVTVDGHGLTARATLGWPKVHVPLSEVVAVTTPSVRPFREFGGWGYRIGLTGRTGFVVRSGPAIEVERPGHRSFVVTVDDAETGAALLTTLADRERSHRVG